MPQVSTRPSQDDDELIEEEAEEAQEKTPAGPVSDRRRRRMMKRGEPNAVIEADEEEDDEAAEVARKDRPTPSTREVVKSRNPVIRFGQNIVDYLQETRDELRKVTWLSREDMMRLTYIVLIVTAASAAFLGLVGFLFGLLTQALATSSSTIVAGIFLMVLIIVVTAGWLFRERLFGGHFE